MLRLLQDIIESELFFSGLNFGSTEMKSLISSEMRDQYWFKNFPPTQVKSWKRVFHEGKCRVAQNPKIKLG